MWMKIDDGLHAHRKTRAVVRSNSEKTRDSAPMGLWVLAGSWSARNNRDGWVPAEELDRFDDDWEALARRLVRAGYWWPEQRDGEDGYGFNDWQEWNNPDGASASGSFGNHVRWHVNKGVAKPDCEHCPTEPDEPEPIAPISGATRPDDRPDIAPESGGESLRDHRPDSLTRTQPEPIPDPSPEKTLADESAPPEDYTPDGQIDTYTPGDRFEEFWDTYGHKVKRPAAELKWRQALKKPGVTAELLIAAAAAYVTYERENNEGGRYISHPSTWLHNERWRDERRAAAPPQTRVGQHIALVQQLAAEEAAQTHLEIGQRR